MLKIVNVMGSAGAGKDTVFKIIQDLYKDKPVLNVKFSAVLKKCLVALDPTLDSGERLSSVLEKLGYSGGSTEDIFDTIKDDEKYGIRRLLQRLGTEVGRDLISDDVWVDVTITNLLKTIEEDKVCSTELNGIVVFTDCRFKNEYDAISRLIHYETVLGYGGKAGYMFSNKVAFLRILRDNTKCVGNHSSENFVRSLTSNQVVDIVNNGTIKELSDKIEEVLGEYLD